MAIKTEIIGQSPKFVGQSDFIYVPMVVFNQTIKTGLFRKNVNTSVQLMSNNGFRTEDEALSFIPIFIAEKIKSNDLPKDIIKKDDKGKDYIDDTICQPGYLKVRLSVLELDE